MVREIASSDTRDDVRGIRAWLRNRAGVSAIGVVLFASLFRKIDSYDVWFYLTVGRKVWRDLAIPQTEFYLAPLLGTSGTFHEWGFGVAAFLAHELGGEIGLCVLQALLATIMLLLLLRAAHREGERLHAAKIAAVVAVLIWVDYRLIYRAEIVLYLAIAAVILVMERFCDSRKRSLLFAPPLICWVQSLGHPSVLVPLAVYGAYSLQAAWSSSDQWRGRAREMTVLSVVGFVALAAAAVNPYGAHQILAPLNLAPELVSTNIEFLPTHMTEQLWPGLLLAFVSAAAIRWSPDRRIVDGLLLCVFGFLAFRYVRNVALLAIVMGVPMAQLFAWVAGRVSEHSARWGSIGPPVLAVALVLLAVGRPVVQGRWGIGVDERVLPRTVVDTIEAVAPPGNIFGFEHFGGYLAWRLDEAHYVFADGRHDTFHVAIQMHDAILTASPGWRELLERYEMYTLVFPATLGWSGRLIPLVEHVVDDPRWVLCGVDESALLFFRADVVDLPQTVTPLAAHLVWEQVLERTQAVLDVDPAQLPAHEARAMAFERLGRRNEAERERRIIREL